MLVVFLTIRLIGEVELIHNPCLPPQFRCRGLTRIQLADAMPMLRVRYHFLNP